MHAGRVERTLTRRSGEDAFNGGLREVTHGQVRETWFDDDGPPWDREAIFGVVEVLDNAVPDTVDLERLIDRSSEAVDGRSLVSCTTDTRECGTSVGGFPEREHQIGHCAQAASAEAEQVGDAAVYQVLRVPAADLTGEAEGNVVLHVVTKNQE